MCGFFKRDCLEFQQFFPLTQSLMIFLQPEVVGTYLPGTGTLGSGAWCGGGIPHSEDLSLLNFYPPYVGE